MVIKKLLCAALLLAGLMSSAEVSAQGTTNIWNGVNITSARNEAILLYNVGTGRLLIHGGDWGTQARLFYQNWGDMLTLKYSNNAYQIATPFGTNKYFTVNVPGVTSAKTSWTDPAEVWQPIMDGSGQYSGASQGQYSTNLTFTRVESSSNTTTYTYYISQTPKSGSTYYIGAAYGMSSATEFMTDLGDDECAYTTEQYAKATTTYTIGDATQVTAQALYQWRVIKFSDYEAYVTGAADELTANISYDIIDQDFTRDVNSFYDNWTPMETAATRNTASQGSGRFIYTWGFSAQGTRQRHRDWYGTIDANNSALRVSGKWCTPIRLKEQFSDDWIWAYTLYGCTSENAKNSLTDAQKAQVSRGQMKDAKYGFMSFEGVGAVYSSITAPATGWYQVSCIGFSQSATQNRGYLFAASSNSNSPVDPSTLDYDDDKYAKAFLKTVAAGTYDRTSYMECMGDNELNPNLSKVGAGYVLTRQQDDFRTTVMIYAQQGDIIYFGAGKDAGTPTVGYGNYYYDADWVPTDNYQIVFLGNSVVVFDENETSINYLKDNGNDKEYTNTTARLKRTFAKDAWNSFVFPINLTSRQVKEAFGANVGLAKLVSIGSLSGLADCIDFQSVQLPADNNSIAIEAGKFYIIKPTADPSIIDGENYYILGTHTFSTTSMNTNGGWLISNPVVSSDYYVVDQAATQDSPSYEQYKDNQIKWYATYVSSGDAKSVPAKSYVLGNNDGDINTPTKMYHLTKDTKILGFRGWIRDKADIEGTGSSGAKDLNIFVTNSFDETSGISTIPVTLPYMNNVIYDISGRQVGKISGTTVVLPREKGMYIVNGKKYIVK